MLPLYTSFMYALNDKLFSYKYSFIFRKKKQMCSVLNSASCLHTMLGVNPLGICICRKTLQNKLFLPPSVGTMHLWNSPSFFSMSCKCHKCYNCKSLHQSDKLSSDDLYSVCFGYLNTSLSSISSSQLYCDDIMSNMTLIYSIWTSWKFNLTLATNKL